MKDIETKMKKISKAIGKPVTFTIGSDPTGEREDMAIIAIDVMQLPKEEKLSKKEKINTITNYIG